MDELFVAPEQLKRKKVDYMLQSQIPQEWPDEIQEVFERQFPFLQDLPKEISFEKVSPEQASAVGRVFIPINGDSIVFPIIVRNGRLAPFDVFIYKDKYYPATDLRLQSLLHLRSSFIGVSRGVPADITTSLVRSYFPPVAIAGLGPVKTAERLLLDRIAYGLTFDRKKYLMEKLASLLPAAVSPSARIIIKAIETQVVPSADIPCELNQNIPWDVIQVRRDRNEYYLYIGSSKLAAPFRVKLRPEHLKELLKGDLYNRIFVNPAFSFMLRTPSYLRGTVKIITATRASDFTSITTALKVQVSNESGRMDGYTFPLKKLTDPLESAGILFLSSSGHYYIGDAIFGVPLGPNDCNWYTQERLLKPGDTFVMINPKTKTAFVPQTVLKITITRDIVEVHTLTGTKIEICSSDKLSQRYRGTHFVIDPSGGVSVNDFIIRKLEKEFVPSTVAPEITLAKVAIKKVDENKYAMYGMNLTSPDNTEYFSKHAERIPEQTEYTKQDLEFLLAHIGATPEDVDRIVKLAENDFVYLDYKSAPRAFAPQRYENSARVLHKIAEFFRKSVTDEIIKAAIAVEDPETLDKILALKVITPETMAEFIAAIPEFESIIERLSKLLVATRLGAQFDESALEQAITFLEDTLMRLRMLEMEQKTSQEVIS